MSGKKDSPSCNRGGTAGIRTWGENMNWDGVETVSL